jgi:DNA polymerase-3 subunit epsilon
VLVVIPPTSEELAAHYAYLEALDRESKGRCLWLQEALAA